MNVGMRAGWAPAAARRRGGQLEPASGQVPLLVGAAVAGPQVKLGAVGGVGPRVVQALAGDGVDQRSVARLPLLVGAAVALPQLDEGAVGGAGAGDVQALAVDLDGPVGRHRPGLVGAAVAVPDLDLGAVSGGLGVVVHALGAVHARRDRPGRPAAGRPGDRQVVELIGLVAG